MDAPTTDHRRTAPRRALGGGAGVLALALALAGCSPAGEDEAPSEAAEEQPAGGEAAEDRATGSAGGQDDAGTASSAAPRTQDLDEVVAELTAAIPSSPEDQTTVGVQSLTVEGDVMVLRLVVTPDFASVPEGEELSLFEALGEAPFSPTLVDRENLTEYSVISEQRTFEWSSDPVSSRTANGSPVLAWGVFAAPQDDVDTLDLRILDVWPELDDVPITR